jgi:hypothetical protein
MRQLVEGEVTAVQKSAPKPPGRPALHEEQEILGIAREAGLQTIETAYLEYVEEYADVETMARGMLAAPPGRAARRATSAEVVRQVLREAVQLRVSDTGTVRLREDVRYLIATP